jgi:hypothetical protein
VLAKKLRGMAYARAIGETNAAARAYRAQFGARELMLIWPDSSAKVTGDAVARALGLRAAIDETVGWHKTISNVTVPGSPPSRRMSTTTCSTTPPMRACCGHHHDHPHHRRLSLLGQPHLRGRRPDQLPSKAPRARYACRT